MQTAAPVLHYSYFLPYYLYKPINVTSYLCENPSFLEKGPTQAPNILEEGMECKLLLLNLQRWGGWERKRWDFFL